jgi:hypothetical protein
MSLRFGVAKINAANIRTRLVRCVGQYFDGGLGQVTVNQSDSRDRRCSRTQSVYQFRGNRQGHSAIDYLHFFQVVRDSLL